MVSLLKSSLFLIPGVYIFLLLNACSTEEASVKEEAPAKKKFEMYEQSEMSALMRQMLHQNEQLRERIQSGEDLGSFPASFERILEAKMTDDKKVDDFFRIHAEHFLASQKSIYDEPENAKERFNQAIGDCVACHKVKCAGPIPTIEKLYIK